MSQLLPSRSLELNPVKYLWQYLRQTWPSSRFFETYDAILDAGYDAWNRLTARPETIMSIGHARLGSHGSGTIAAGITH